MASLSRICVYPFKSLDPMQVAACDVLASGALKWDRAFALVDDSGKNVNGKRAPEVHGLRAEWNSDFSGGILHGPKRPELGTLRIDFSAPDFDDAEVWLAQFFDRPISILQNPEGGFPDDTDSPGPTVISTATVETVAGWFGLSPDSVRLRFRANLEIGEVPPFWEERLYGEEKGRDVPFAIGMTQFYGTNPCQRCIVPTRDALSGEPFRDFQKIFQERRKATLPDWAEPARFDHYYRLAVNTRGATGSPSAVHVGDTVRM
jgi:uncharacterized protein